MLKFQALMFCHKDNFEFSERTYLFQIATKLTNIGKKRASEFWVDYPFYLLI